MERQAQAQQIRAEARTAGYNAKRYADCPYISGQRIMNDWHAGFVARCVETGKTPSDTPMYLLGRIGYLQGKTITDYPEGEVASGRWVSGWLMQRDAAQGEKI